jgi:hypothetical protein
MPHDGRSEARPAGDRRRRDESRGRSHRREHPSLLWGRRVVLDETAAEQAALERIEEAQLVDLSASDQTVSSAPPGGSSYFFSDSFDC